MEHWPWWGGALALAFASVGYAALVRRPLGSSGAVHLVVNGDPADDVDDVDDADVEAELLAITRAAFGDAAEAPDPAAPSAPPTPPMAPPLGVRGSAVFLVALAVGGFLSSALAGNFGTHALPSAWIRLFSEGPWGAGVLFVGGLLVGFGTQLAGGCTMGHGLYGCARLQRGSLLATAAYVVTGIALSLALAGLVGGEP